MAGLHGTTFASQDLREFGELMGAQEGPHQYNGEPGTLKIDDPGSPLTKHFGGKGFSMMDEFYHFPPTGPYTREKLHVLLSVGRGQERPAEMALPSPRPRLRHGVDQARGQRARLQQRAGTSARLLHDAGPREADGGRHSVRARRSRRRHDAECETIAITRRKTKNEERKEQRKTNARSHAFFVLRFAFFVTWSVLSFSLPTGTLPAASR